MAVIIRGMDSDICTCDNSIKKMHIPFSIVFTEIYCISHITFEAALSTSVFQTPSSLPDTVCSTTVQVQKQL